MSTTVVIRDARGDFAQGDTVTWLYTPRGGYGFRYPVDGVVMKIGPRRVQVEVQHYSGKKCIWVTPEKLVLRHPVARKA